jgi:hypothetical protein
MGEPDWEIAEAQDFDWSDSTPAPVSKDMHLPQTDGQHWEHTEHNIHTGLNVAKFVATCAELYEIFHVSGAALAASHGGLAAAAGWVAPVAPIAVVIVTFMELHKAFTTTQRIETAKGVTYGIMWGVLGVPDVPHTTRPGPFGGTLELTKSEREAFEEGVKEGRKMAQDPKVREQVERALAAEMALQKRDPTTDPQHRAWNVAVDKTMNRIWDGVHEKNKALDGSKLNWIGKNDGFPK